MLGIFRGWKSSLIVPAGIVWTDGAGVAAVGAGVAGVGANVWEVVLTGTVVLGAAVVPAGAAWFWRLRATPPWTFC